MRIGDNSCPCKDCKNRHSHCHSECEYYSFWKSEMTKEKEQINKLREVDAMLDKVKKVGIERIKRNKRHGH